MNPAADARPLDGLRVVDLCVDRAGSVAGMLLADLGANVVRPETVDGAHHRPAPSVLPDAVCWDRGKQSAIVSRLDPADAGLAALLAVTDAVLIDGSPGVRSGGPLDPTRLAEALPRAAIVWLPAYGDGGERYRNLPADSLLLNAIGGYAGRQPTVGDVPIAPVVPVVEQVQGALGAAATVAALLERTRSGLGQRVTVSGVNATAALMGSLMTTPLDQATVYRPGREARAAPNFREFRCGDGRWIFLAALVAPLFLAALEVLDALDVMVMEGIDGEFFHLFQQPYGRRAAERVEAAFATRPAQYWLDALEAAGVPCAPVWDRGQWVASEAFAAIGGRYVFAHPLAGPVTTPVNPIRFEPATSPDSAATTSPAWPARANGGTDGIGGTEGLRPPGPLAGLRVVDLSNYLAGPFGPTILAQWGADVVKVESVDGDPYRVYNVAYVAVNQGKQSVVTDLHSDEGRELLWRLITHADVLVDNLRPSARARLGLDMESVRRANPRLVHANITAFGMDGPFAERPGFDPVIQALSGLMAASGEPAEPVSTTTPVHDVATASLVALGVLAGCWHRSRHGSGSTVLTSLAGAASLVQCAELTEFAGRPTPAQGGIDFVGPSAGSRFYRASDGWVAIAAPSTDALGALAQALEVDRALVEASPTSADADADATGLGAHGPLAQAIAARIEALTVAEALSLAEKVGVPTASTPADDDWMTDEHLAANELSHIVVDPALGRCQVVHRFAEWSRSGSVEATTAPERGQHTAEVRQQLGLVP